MIRIMSVMSCSASQTSCRKVLGGLGGMTFAPNTSLRCRMSSADPLKPARQQQTEKFLHLFMYSRTQTDALNIAVKYTQFAAGCRKGRKPSGRSPIFRHCLFVPTSITMTEIRPESKTPGFSIQVSFVPCRLPFPKS